ncbi:MAG: hypothetical protein OEV37_04110, partial [Candidatus Berkelbacteria bacterium]|nr:hypothetical protein [Candidatus Berkelbacteria bacterium]
AGTLMLLAYLGVATWLTPKILRLFTLGRAKEFEEAKQGSLKDTVVGVIFVFWPVSGILGCAVWGLRWVAEHDQPVPDPNAVPSGWDPNAPPRPQTDELWPPGGACVGR